MLNYSSITHCTCRWCSSVTGQTFLILYDHHHPIHTCAWQLLHLTEAWAPSHKLLASTSRKCGTSIIFHCSITMGQKTESVDSISSLTNLVFYYGSIFLASLPCYPRAHADCSISNMCVCVGGGSMGGCVYEKWKMYAIKKGLPSIKMTQDFPGF